MEIWSNNRGEWTEAYVFLKLLGEGKIFGATANLKKDASTYIDIIRIIRDEPDKCRIFERFAEDRMARVKMLKDEEILKEENASVFLKKATSLYGKIKTITTRTGAICIPDCQKYLEEWDFNSPKSKLSDSAKKKYGEKTDIIITAEDSFDHAKSTCGFSIKSHLGSSPTLFNSSQTSGFVFRIENCDEEGMYIINQKDNFLDIISTIKNDYSLKYVGCRNEIFEQNIQIVDSRMDEILQYVVLLNAGYLEGSISPKLVDICKALAKHNPIGVRNPDVFYVAKLKSFLFASFAGLTASREWNGSKKLSGGYIDVDRDGEMLYYRAISDDVFENYLFNHTYIDRPDRGVNKDLAVAEAQKHLAEHVPLTKKEIEEIIYKKGKKQQLKGDFGYVYQKEGLFYIAINFQIRFK